MIPKPISRPYQGDVGITGLMPASEAVEGAGVGPQLGLASVPAVDEGIAQRPAGVRSWPVQAPGNVEHPGPAGLIPAVRRRQLHDIMRHPGYDSMLAARGEGLPGDW